MTSRRHRPASTLTPTSPPHPLLGRLRRLRPCSPRLAEFLDFVPRSGPHGGTQLTALLLVAVAAIEPGASVCAFYGAIGQLRKWAVAPPGRAAKDAREEDLEAFLAAWRLDVDEIGHWCVRRDEGVPTSASGGDGAYPARDENGHWCVRRDEGAPRSASGGDAYPAEQPATAVVVAASAPRPDELGRVASPVERSAARGTPEARAAARAAKAAEARAAARVPAISRTVESMGAAAAAPSPRVSTPAGPRVSAPRAPRTLADYPIGWWAIVPRIDADGSNFSTWCRVAPNAQHRPQAHRPALTPTLGATLTPTNPTAALDLTLSRCRIVKHREGLLVVEVPGGEPGAWEKNQSVSVRLIAEVAREEAPLHCDY